MDQSRPRDRWNGLDSLNSTSGQLYEQIRHVLDSADLNHLEHLALVARKNADVHLDKAVDCSINPSIFSYGFSSVVFEVAFSDDVYWVAKVQHAAMDETDAVYMLSEIATMKLVKERTTVPVPCVFGHQVRSSDEFEFPFLFMEFLPGRDVGGPLARDVPGEFLPKVAKQLADVLFQLETMLSFKDMGIIWRGADCDGPPEIISLPSDDCDHPLEQFLSPSPPSSPKTSLEWFYNHRQEENKEVMESHPNDQEWNTACWVLKDAISQIILEDRVHGPFPLCHMDFHHGNLLFDEEYNLTGVLDWSRAQTVPLERLAVSPEFVAGPLCPQEEKESVARLLSSMRSSLRDLHQDARCEESPDSKEQASPTRDGDCEPNEETEAQDCEHDADLHTTAHQTTLADIFGTVQAEITNRCTLSNPRVALWFGRMVQRLVFGGHVSWEQMVKSFGEKRLH